MSPVLMGEQPDPNGEGHVMLEWSRIAWSIDAYSGDADGWVRVHTLQLLHPGTKRVNGRVLQVETERGFRKTGVFVKQGDDVHSRACELAIREMRKRIAALER